ncbi:hypothetical protein [Agaribacter marinus]|uniref:Serine protease n=1 Tax=Agaribacter marinus TaxID=1431249 RepID=A0AA37SY28_9ALTE|nr:hypothetical protein [Agaribacter marinus]GLR70245.1 hypothetical protein GCM10007852_11530 [Agaribacter marinus]
MATSDNSQELDEQVSKIVDVQEQTESHLLQLANVNGVGIGYKVSKNKTSDELCLIVFVTSKLKANDLDKKDTIPTKIEGVKTDVVEVGEIEAQAYTAKLRPAQPGYSIGHYKVTAGTFGAVVRDTCYPCRYYILSNNHVLANSNGARIGDPILQPGRVDGGKNPADKIATLQKFVPIKFGSVNNYNLVDAAIARPTDIKYIYASIKNLGIPKGIEEATLNMPVIKTGRTTQTTTGTVNAVNATVAVNFGSAGVAYFKNQIMTNDMSNGGDSGSVLLNRRNRNVVGLLFAGSSTVTIFNNIHNVMMALNVTPVTAS